MKYPVNHPINHLIIATGLIAGLITGNADADGAHMICTPNPVVCTNFDLVPNDRFDPFVQHLLVRQQIQALPLAPQITNFYMPYQLDKRSLEEIQIRFMDELQRREAAKTESVATE